MAPTASPAPPAVVIMAHDRPASLERLLGSLGRADLANGTAVVISIDGGSPRLAEVTQAATQQRADIGPIEVVHHEPLGLVGHFHACGELVERFGNIVVLEDDLIVAPGFQNWAIAALRQASGDDRIAGVSLAAPVFDGYRHLPFEPLPDGTDAIYAQVPWYDGMAWSTALWRRFRDHEVDAATPIHRSLLGLDDDEWFPDAVRYLVETERFFVWPREAQAANTGAPGTHFDDATDYFQTVLAARSRANWAIDDVDQALAIYDDHLELHPSVLARLLPDLDGQAVIGDMLGVRDLATVGDPLVLTTRAVTHARRAWGASMHPLVSNVIHDVAGDRIRLARASDVDASRASQDASLATLQQHAHRGRKRSTRQALRESVDLGRQSLGRRIQARRS